jgi:hypothetical protein
VRPGVSGGTCAAGPRVSECAPGTSWLVGRYPRHVLGCRAGGGGRAVSTTAGIRAGGGGAHPILCATKILFFKRPLLLIQAARRALIELMPHASYRLEVVGMARSFMSPALLPRSQPHPANNCVWGEVRGDVGQRDSGLSLSHTHRDRESGEIAVVVVFVQVSAVDGSALRGRGQGSCEPAQQVFVTVFLLPRPLTNSVRACASS